MDKSTDTNVHQLELKLKFNIESLLKSGVVSAVITDLDANTNSNSVAVGPVWSIFYIFHAVVVSWHCDG